MLAGNIPTYKNAILSDGPIGFWLLDETSGSTAEDSTTNNNDLTYQNSPTLNVSTGLTGLTKAITLNGTNQRAVRTTDTATFNLSANSSWAIELWVRFSTTSFSTVYQVRNSDAQSTTSLAGITINNGATGRIQGQVLNQAGDTLININSDGGWNNNIWHHIVFTAASSGDATLYIDGVSRASSNAARYSNTSNKGIYVGSNISSQYYTGSLSAPAIYAVTLSASDVLRNYNAGL